MRKSSDVCWTSALSIAIPRRSASRIARRQMSTFFSDAARVSLQTGFSGDALGDGMAIEEPEAARHSRRAAVD
jgi:hypothetical protein